MTPPTDHTPPPLELDWSFTPAEAALRWPADRPLAALISDGDASDAARWSILAAPGRPAPGETPLDVLRGIDASIHRPSTRIADERARNPDAPPFAGGWLGWLGYDLGRELEPSAGRESGARDDRGWPSLQMLRCDGAYVHDRRSGRWRRVGDPASLPDLNRSGPAAPAGWSVAALRSRSGRDAYIDAVTRALAYINEGDIYQANIAHRLSAPFEGNARALFARLCETMGPRYAGFIESPDGRGAVLSFSPELFLRFDPATRRVETRPIKGTRPATVPPAELLSAEKDAAELTMIVDLMRNDLGRVCDFGSVRVTDPRSIETHGGAGAMAAAGVHHAVATIEGRMRAGLGVADLIAASFPAGSITGAPKIRAMQIVDELEPVRRGPYCGAVGFISDSGHASFNVAIRTASIRGESACGCYMLRGELDYSVGAGIVADSDPVSEWEETLAKAAVFQRTIAMGSPPETISRERPAAGAGAGAGA